ncbi:MAG: pyridoxamine 5'-phosphate oxidase family protein [Acidimicrobiales bacterium]
MTTPHEPSTGDPGSPDERVRVRRVPDRASYSRDDVKAILDEGLVAHVGTVRDGSPVVIPMFYARHGDWLLLHGAPASGTIRKGAGIDVCVTVTLVDGLVLARSAFHHSMNYRSVVVVGVAEAITDRADKIAALDRFVEGLVPGRTADLRPMTAKEIDGTGVLRVSLEHASAKVRTGDPVDDEEDYDLPIWAGLVPVVESFGSPVADARLQPGVPIPVNVAALG